MDINEIHFQPNVRLVPLLSFPYCLPPKFDGEALSHCVCGRTSCLSRFVHFNEILRPMYWASVVKEDFDRLKQFRMGLRDSRRIPTSPLDHGHHRRNWTSDIFVTGSLVVCGFLFRSLAYEETLCCFHFCNLRLDSVLCTVLRWKKIFVPNYLAEKWSSHLPLCNW